MGSGKAWRGRELARQRRYDTVLQGYSQNHVIFLNFVKARMTGSDMVLASEAPRKRIVQNLVKGSN